MLMSRACFVRLVKFGVYLVLGLFIVLASIALKIVTKSCSIARAEKVQLDLCWQFHHHQVSGDMCTTLCDKRQLSLEYCGNNRASVGRKDVLIYGCDGCDLDRKLSKVVMKIQVTDSVWKDTSAQVLRSATTVGQMINSTIQFVRRRIQSTFDESASFITADMFISGVLGSDFRYLLTSGSDMKAAAVKLETVLALVLQPEVITLLAFKNTSYMPKFYGHCGPAYFVEYTPPLTTSGYVTTLNAKSSDLLNMQYEFRSWSDRARLGLEFLRIIRRMDVLGKRPVQLCDFKPHNFGLGADGRIVFLDSDDIVFDQRASGRRCIHDDQCMTNFCEGICDKQTHTCTSKRKNNNLSIACKYLFLGDYELLGLLRSPPEAVREELRETLVRCSEPEVHNALAKTDVNDYRLLNELENILRKSINVT